MPSVGAESRRLIASARRLVKLPHVQLHPVKALLHCLPAAEGQQRRGHAAPAEYGPALAQQAAALQQRLAQPDAGPLETTLALRLAQLAKK